MAPLVHPVKIVSNFRRGRGADKKARWRKLTTLELAKSDPKENGKRERHYGIMERVQELSALNQKQFGERWKDAQKTIASALKVEPEAVDVERYVGSCIDDFLVVRVKEGKAPPTYFKITKAERDHRLFKVIDSLDGDTERALTEAKRKRKH